MKILKVKDTVTYTRTFAFGKTGKETATVVAIHNGMALLDNGDKIFAIIK